MPSDALSFGVRANVAELTEWMDEPCSREQLRACLRDLERVNRWFLGYRPTLNWLEDLDRGSEQGSHLRRLDKPVRILDVGCGSGDMLRQVERWAQRRRLDVELSGLDLNPDTISIAAEASAPDSRIDWIAANAFDFKPEQPAHLIISSLFAHHLSDAEVVRLLRWMEEWTTLGWFINDLSREPLPARLFGLFARVTDLHPFVQHDGPVSFARAFQPDDWRRLCATAGLDVRDYRILSYKPGRLCVARSKPQ